MNFWAVAAAGAIASFFAGVMLFHRTLYVSAVCLLAVLVQTGVIFVLRGAPLLGLLQVMIYAGAVMVLVVITVMAAGGAPGERFADLGVPRWVAAAAVLAAVVQVVLAFRGDAPLAGAASAPPEAFARTLFSSYAPATEAVTLLMFLAALAVAPDKEPGRP